MASSSSKLLPILGAVGYIQTNAENKSIAGEVVCLLSSARRVGSGDIDERDANVRIAPKLTCFAGLGNRFRHAS